MTGHPDMTGHRDRLVAAFPASMRPEVLQALTWMQWDSPRTSWTVSPGSIDGPRTPAALRVCGEPVHLPARIYLGEPAVDALPGDLPPVQRTILGCLYTRHHDGYVRQRWLRAILPSPHPWVVPFVVQLIGEYVIQITADILRELPDLQDETSPRAEQYGRVLADNPAFLTLVSHRVASYWNCYYRNLHADPRYYPGRILVTALQDAAHTWHRPGAHGRPDSLPPAAHQEGPSPAPEAR